MGERTRILTLVRSHPGLWLAIGLQLIGLVTISHFVTDDALITLRYAKLWAGGEGLRFNPGEAPVEGYSNFAYVVAGAAALRLGLPALACIRAIGFVACVVLVAVTYAFAFESTSSRHAATFAAVIVAVHAPLTYWAASGLETPTYAMWVVLSVWLWSRTEGATRRYLWVPMMAAALTRFDGVAIGASLAAVSVVRGAVFERERFWERDAFWLASFSIIYLLYTAFRLQYFGHVLPNSGSYKLGGPPGAVVWAFTRECLPLVVLASLAPWRRLGWSGAAMATVCVALIVGFWGVRPSVSYFHRFLMPLVPLAAVAGAAAVHRAVSSGGLSRVGAVVAAIITVLWFSFAPNCGWSTVWPRSHRLASRITSRIEVAHLLRQALPAEATIAIGDIGVVSFALPNPMRDIFGLNDSRFVHEFAGDREPYLEAMLASAPDAFVLVSRSAHGRFEGRYASDDLIYGSVAFAQRYRRWATLASPTESYHYVIFVHRDRSPPQVAHTPNARGSLVRQLDAL